MVLTSMVWINMCHPPVKNMTGNVDFEGTWELISFRNEGEDGSVNYPFGKNPRGMIWYDRNGYMGVNIMPEERLKFESGDMFVATERELRDAIRYIAYSGKFEVKENKVIHKIEVALFPNWVGRDQERFYKIDGNRLTLTTKPMKFEGKQVISRLVWEHTGQ